MSRLQQFQATTGKNLKNLRYVLISVDGERDNPAAVKSFLAQFSVIFVGLTGDPRVVNDVAARFRAPFYKGNDTGASSGYTVAHSPQLFVIDRSGKLRAEFYNASFDAMAAIISALNAELEPGIVTKSSND
jgi:protein SCO1/2